MTKLDNYIYFTICEVTLDLYSKTKFVTYTNYCRTMCKSIESAELDKREMSDVMAIVNMLKLIYNMDTDESVKYIKNYFKSDRCNDFKKCVSMTKNVFPFSFN
jgi:hypothetical protein